MQSLESIKDLFKHKNSSRLHFGHKWLRHFRCASGFSGLCHTFFGWGFISIRVAHQWSFSFGRHTSCIEHFVFMCYSSTFLSHLDNTSFLHVFLGEFQQESYAGLWGHYGSKVMKIYSRPLIKMLGLTTNLFWWYKPFIYGGLCPICFYKELGFGGSISML
jgi:hypothetical protein